MKHMSFVLGTALAALSMLSAARSQEGEAPDTVIVDLYGCTYTGNNDMGDLMGVVDRWNDWMDDNDISDYEASLLTPYLNSPAFPYDVIWLGVYPSARAMGAGETKWLRDGREMDAEYAEVLDCTVHAMYVGIPTHMPQSPPNAADGNVDLIAFQDCALHDGRILPEAFQAHGQWGRFLAENGSDNFMGVMVPFAGENPDADYDYKAITAFSSAEAYGNFIDTIVPGGLQRAGQLFGRLTDCDTSRVYTSVEVRGGGN